MGCKEIFRFGLHGWGGCALLGGVGEVKDWEGILERVGRARPCAMRLNFALLRWEQGRFFDN